MYKLLLLIMTAFALQGCGNKDEAVLDKMWNTMAARWESTLGMPFTLVRVSGEIVERGTIMGAAFDIDGRVPAYVGCFNVKNADGSASVWKDERACIFWADIGRPWKTEMRRESLYLHEGPFDAYLYGYAKEWKQADEKTQQQAAAPVPAAPQQPPTPAPAAKQSVYGDKAVPLVETLECRKWRESGASGGIGGNVYSVNSLAINKLDLPAVQGLTTNHEALEYGGERVTVTLPDEVSVYGAAVGEIYLVNQEAVVEQQLYLAHPVNNLVPMVNGALGVTLEWNAGMEAWVFEQDGKHIAISAGPRPDTSKLTCGFS